MRKKQHFGLIFLLVSIIITCGLLYAGFVQTAISSYVRINKGSSSTQVRKVTLNLQGPEWATHMKISNQADLYDTKWEKYKTTKTWYLSYGRGTKTVYVLFKNSSKVSQLYRKSINLSVPAETDPDFSINDDEEETTSRYVTLKIEDTFGVEGYIVNNSNSFKGVEFKQITDKISWVLSEAEGEKTVYMQFLDANGDKKTVSKKINYKNEGGSIFESGSLLKGQGNTIYYYGFDGQLHPFLNSAVYHSWYENFDDIRFVSNSKLKQYQIGLSVCVRPGTWLLKFRGLPKIYSVLPGCQLKPVLSEVEAYLIYGSNWNKRILELDSVYASTYSTLSYDVSDDGDCLNASDIDCDEKVIDRDRDGVDSEMEADYGTSDKRLDSDEDGMTDYEEINYWFTDPTSKDTDGDGFSDSTEILNGYPPAGYGNLNDLLIDNYDYPAGSVIKKKTDGKLYYKHSNGSYYYFGKDSKTSRFKSNRLNNKFIIKSPFKIDFEKSKGSVGSKEKEIYYPTYLLAEEVEKM